MVIALMVYGHTLNSATSAGLGAPESFRSLSDATFSNAVPVFFFVSGFFVERGYSKRGVRVFLIERSLRIAYPYFVWSFLQCAAEIVFSSESHRLVTIDTLLAIPWRPYSVFWFLYTIFWMFPAYALARQAGRWRHVALAALAVLFFVFPVSTNVMALGPFSRNLLFFAAGVIWSHRFVGPERLPTLPLWATLPLTSAFLAISLYVFTNVLPPVQLSQTTYQYHYAGLSVLAGATCVGWAQFLAGGDRLRFLAVIGRYALQIYVAHMLFVVGFRVLANRLLGLESPYLIVGGGIAVGIIGPIVLYRVMGYLGLPNLFEPPLRPSPELSRRA